MWLTKHAQYNIVHIIYNNSDGVIEMPLSNHKSIEHV